MQIYTEPDIAQVRQLLRDNDLPADDLDDHHGVLFFAWGSRPSADGVVGLEIHANVGLLRSLAVRSAARNQGIATALVTHVENYAAENGLDKLYLLTTTAELFFLRQGYQSLPRAAAPEAIRHTQEFSVLCPDDSAFLCKALPPVRKIT